MTEPLVLPEGDTLSRSPVIGIAVRYAEAVALDRPGALPRREFLRLPASYVAAVTASGGIPMLLPPLEEHRLSGTSLVDGIILPGGDDEITADEVREVRKLVDARIPLLGICRGHQLLNMALGGTLLLDLPTQVVDHRPGPNVSGTHAIDVDEASKLGRVTGASALVNTSHFWAVDQLGADLRPVAHASDGTIEAVESSSHPWLLGVQFHPERLHEAEPWSRRLFEEFVFACRRTER